MGDGRLSLILCRSGGDEWCFLDDRQTAVASGNAHRTHFGEKFTITLPDGSLAHSACAGLGLERAAIALMVTHGFDVQAWPAEVKQKLGL